MLPSSTPPSGKFGKRFWPLFLLGLVGVASLPFMLVPLIQAGQMAENMPDLPTGVLVALSLLNPVLLLAGGTAVGAWLAPKLHLLSLVAARAESGSPIAPPLRAAALVAIASGLAVATALLVLELAFRPFLSPEWTTASAEAFQPGGVGLLITGLLYGGITEEILLRWGMLSLFAWLFWRLFQRGRPAPSSGVMWAAIVVAALLFGIAHLPAAAALAPLDSILVLRVVSLNAIGGMVFGWLFWRRHLEAAMLAHASAHVGFAIFRLLGWM